MLYVIVTRNPGIQVNSVCKRSCIIKKKSYLKYAVANNFYTLKSFNVL